MPSAANTRPERLEVPDPIGAVLVIGGGGFYGRYLVADILQYTPAPVMVASRRLHSPWSSERVQPVVCDLNDLDALKRQVARSHIVVHCAGPFQYLPLNPLRAALDLGVHYIDIAEDREYARQAAALVRTTETTGTTATSRITVLNGLSVAPAMEALFTELLRPCLDSIISIRTFAAPDTRKHRGTAMFHTMLLGVGRTFQQPRRGRLVPVYGWGEPEWVDFPPPVGRRLTYLVLEMADLDVLPALFGAQTVEFKAGTEHPFLNRLLGWAAALRARTGHPRWERYMGLVRACSWLAGRWGRDEGGVMFEVTGLRDQQPQTYRIALMAAHDGGVIPAVLGGMAVEELLSGRLTRRGLVPVHQWISSQRLVEGLQRRSLQLWWQPPNSAQWQPFSLPLLTLT